MSTNPSRSSNFGIIICCILVIDLLLIGLIGMLYLKAKEEARHIQIEKSGIRNFELVAINPPKHFYVDIKDMETRGVYKHVFVSKHCNSWRETTVVGKVYQITVDTYRDDRNGIKSVEYRDLYQVFCK